MIHCWCRSLPFNAVGQENYNLISFTPPLSHRFHPPLPIDMHVSPQIRGALANRLKFNQNKCVSGDQNVMNHVLRIHSIPREE